MSSFCVHLSANNQESIIANYCFIFSTERSVDNSKEASDCLVNEINQFCNSMAKKQLSFSPQAVFPVIASEFAKQNGYTLVMAAVDTEIYVHFDAQLPAK